MAPILPKNQTHDDCQSFDTCRNPATAVTSLGSTGWPGEPQSTWQPVDANGVRYADGSSPASQRRRSLQDQAHLRVSISGLAVRLAQPPTGARCSHFPLQPVCQGCESYETGGETTLSQAVLLAGSPASASEDVESACTSSCSASLSSLINRVTIANRKLAERPHISTATILSIGHSVRHV
jgi:hypothetical protein